MSQAVANPLYYIDAQTINPWDNSNPSSTIQVKRSSAILTNSSDYDVAIIRATYPLNALPLGIVPMLTGQTVNTTPFSVSILRNGITTTRPVLWTPEYLDVPVPVSTSAQDLSRYYYYYSVASLLSCINTALSTCATASGSTNPPLITFDPASSRFTIFFPTSDYGSAITNAFASTLSVNGALSQLFPNFASTTNGALTTFRIPSPVSSATIAGISYNALAQEVANITAWDSLSTISMSTDLGIVPEDVSSYSSLNVGSSSARNSSMTDVILDSGSGELSAGTRSGVLQYLPSSQFRWINMRASSFNSFNIFIHWTTKQGQTFPLVLPAGSQATMKLLFKYRGSARAVDQY